MLNAIIPVVENALSRPDFIKDIQWDTSSFSVVKAVWKALGYVVDDNGDGIVVTYTTKHGHRHFIETFVYATATVIGVTTGSHTKLGDYVDGSAFSLEFRVSNFSMGPGNWTNSIYGSMTSDKVELARRYFKTLALFLEEHRDQLQDKEDHLLGSLSKVLQLIDS